MWPDIEQLEDSIHQGIDQSEASTEVTWHMSWFSSPVTLYHRHSIPNCAVTFYNLFLIWAQNNQSELISIFDNDALKDEVNGFDFAYA